MAHTGFLYTSLKADVSVYSRVTDKVTRRTGGEPAPQRETQNTHASHRLETQPPRPQRPCRLGLHLESGVFGADDMASQERRKLYD